MVLCVCVMCSVHYYVLPCILCIHGITCVHSPHVDIYTRTCDGRDIVYSPYWEYTVGTTYMHVVHMHIPTARARVYKYRREEVDTSIPPILLGRGDLSHL